MEIGDKVQWTHVSQRGGEISMSLRAGVLLGYKGRMARVQCGKRVVEVEPARLRPLNAPTQLGEFVEAVREGARKEPTP